MTNYARPGTFITESFSPLTTGGAGVPGAATPAFALAYPRGPITPQLITSWSQFVQLYGDFTVAPGNALPFAVNQFFQNGGGSCYVLRIPNADASSCVLGLNDLDDTQILEVTAESPGIWGQNLLIEVVAAGTGYVNVNVYLGGTTTANLVETYPYVSTDPGNTRNVAVVINSVSNYLTVAETLPPGGYEQGVTDLAPLSPTNLTSGGDGIVAPAMGTAVPDGFDQLPDVILNVNIPGVQDYTTISAMLNWAESRGDVMVVIDGPTPSFPETTTTVTNAYLAMLSGGSALPSSTYAVVYAPWVLVADPSSTVAGATRLVPPGALALGQWQATDVLYGPQQTPAGIRNTLHCVDLECRFTSANQDALNIAQINAIVYRPGTGFCIMGGRTLHPGYPDRYISVRRTIMMLEHDVETLTAFALFAPNDSNLWAQITAVLTQYLASQFQAGLLGGASLSDSFSVVCDATLNTPATAAAGIVNATIAVNLASPAEWVMITLSQIQATGTSSTTTTTA